MSDYILGTAGHVDHGKTTLIKALTGIDADRLPQEKERGLTLDLGFANIQLPSGRVCSIVDVPGHEKYLKNMLAGVGGFDFALLIIDASEGIMPQTIEHFEILKLLNIQDGLPVITKADLVSAQEIEKLKTQLKDFIRDSFLEKSPAMTVSAVSGQGIEELKSEIDNRLEQLTPRDLSLPGRLAIDRVFVKPGFGVVVTGSMFQGSFELYQKVVVLPSTQKAKIRKIQFQGEDVKEARAGQRIALNLGGVDSAVIKRGNQVTASGTLFNTVEFDAKIKVLDSSPHPLKHRDEIRLYITTDEVFGKVFLLDRSELEPGETGFVRIMLDEIIATQMDDLFILRSPSALFTWGGGKVLDVAPPRHRRFDKAVIENLKMKDENEPEVIFEEKLKEEPYCIYTPESVAGAASQDVITAGAFIKELDKKGKLHRFAAGGFVHKEVLEKMVSVLLENLEFIEEEYPGSFGRRPEELLKNMPKLGRRLFREVIMVAKQRELIKEKDGLISTIKFKPGLPLEALTVKNWIMDELKDSFAPPALDELYEKTEFDNKLIRYVVSYLLYTHELIQLDEKIVFPEETVTRAKKILGEYIVREGPLTPSTARKLLDTTRKYVIPLLEYLDKIYFTRRTDKGRVLVKQNVILGI